MIPFHSSVRHSFSYIYPALESTLKHSITELLDHCRHFTTNDILVHVSGASPKVLEQSMPATIPQTEFPKRIAREYQQTVKESGIHPLCSAVGTVVLSLSKQAVTTPIWLIPARLKLNKLHQTYTVEHTQEVGFINPFLLYHFNQELELTLPTTSYEALLAFLQEQGLVVDRSVQFIGNFHHHRFEIIRELEELINVPVHSSVLKEILGAGKASEHPLSLSNHLLFPADTDQLEVFRQLNASSIALQGPPGTGKSQVLANIIGKNIRKRLFNARCV